jgi:hypothetical protein
VSHQRRTVCPCTCQTVDEGAHAQYYGCCVLRGKTARKQHKEEGWSQASCGWAAAPLLSTQQHHEAHAKYHVRCILWGNTATKTTATAHQQQQFIYNFNQQSSHPHPQQRYHQHQEQEGLQSH